jgi:hypothetical protein
VTMTLYKDDSDVFHLVLAKKNVRGSVALLPTDKQITTPNILRILKLLNIDSKKMKNTTKSGILYKRVNPTDAFAKRHCH